MAEVTKKKKSLIGHYSKMERKFFPFVYIMLLLPVAQIIVMWFWVNIKSIGMAFGLPDEFTFNNFVNVFKAFQTGRDIVGLNPAESLWKSAVIWTINNIPLQILTLLTTYMLTKHMVGSRVLRVIYTMPGLVGGVVFSSLMKEMYSANGAIVTILESMGAELPWYLTEFGFLGAEETAFWTLVFQHFFFGLAGGGMVMAGAYMRIPQEVFESAKLDGCGFFRETFQLAIPCAWPTVSTLMIFGLCGIFTADLSFYMYSNGTGAFGMTSVGFYLYKFQTLFTENGGTGYQHAYNYLAAFGLCITVITVPLAILGRHVLTKFNDGAEF